MSKTRIDLVAQALVDLGVLAAGQTPASEDTTTMDAYIDPLIANLDKRDVVTIDDGDAIPDELFLPLAVLLADAAAKGFGLPGIPASPSDPSPKLLAENSIREVTYARPTRETLGTEYF